MKTGYQYTVDDDNYIKSSFINLKKRVKNLKALDKMDQCSKGTKNGFEKFCSRQSNSPKTSAQTIYFPRKLKLSSNKSSSMMNIRRISDKEKAKTKKVKDVINTMSDNYFKMK